MNRSWGRTINILDSYLKERLSEFIMYIGFMCVFPIIFFLYNIRADAVKYAFLLSFVWFLAWEVMRFTRYKRQHEALLETEKKASEELYGLPVPLSVIEEDYQRILKKIYHDKVELESAGREFKKEIEDYYGMWAHQIKTPIAALKVLLQSYTLGGGAEKDSKKCAQTDGERIFGLIREMKPEVFKIEQYVEMVLTYLRTTDMTSDFVFKTYELDDIIRQAVKKYSQMFILQKIKLNYGPVKQEVLTDEKWLTFVIEQLLSNALKYTRQGSISIYMESGCLVIEDTGIGIWPEDLPRVFEKGFTGYNGRENKKSTGIGLYLCKTVIDKLRHGIWLESEVGKGTKAYIRLERKESFIIA
ncbi:MAG: HAMP domain-containing histidine kinase [Dorea sp.]|jgi:signal transduction histidine kinase|nr:HAMP domain-containing histidine kinase [Dorea sp.]